MPDACARLSLSPATARRAFARLAAGGLAEKVWGGLMRGNPATTPGYDMVPSSLRDQLNAEAKDAIARQAAMLVEDGDVVAIDGGTTTLRLSSYLANRPILILTNSILIAHRIEQLRSGAKSAEVFLTGGFVYPGSGLLVGPQAATNLPEYHSQWAFLSVGGLDERGTTNTNQLVVESQRAMMNKPRMPSSWRIIASGTLRLLSSIQNPISSIGISSYPAPDSGFHTRLKPKP